jgi:hypothetical protein
MAAKGKEIQPGVFYCDTCGSSGFINIPLKWDRCPDCKGTGYLGTPEMPGRCCEQATTLPCVCYASWQCPTHGSTHIGTHD